MGKSDGSAQLWEYVTPESIANKYCMLTAGGGNPAMLVIEGEDDRYIMQKHLDPRITLSCAAGKAQVLAVRNELLNRGVDLGNIRFLVDSDFDDILGIEHVGGTELICSDTHDIVMDVVVLDKVLIERYIESVLLRAKPSVMNAIGVGASYPERLPFIGSVIRDAFEAGKIVSALRVVNGKNNYGLKLRDFPFGLVERFDVSSIVKIAFDRAKATDLLYYSDPDSSSEKFVSRIEVEDEISSVLMEFSSSSYPAVGDHDFFSAVAKVVEYKTNVGSVKELEAVFYTGLHCGMLGEVRWFSLIREWVCVIYGSDSKASCVHCK